MNLFTLAGAERADAVRVFLSAHAARLRSAMREKDQGASAIELAIITAVLVGLAVIILAIIYKFADAQANTITTHTIPGNGN